ncbi:radical SAM/SPASM family putative metalloenzyme maturase [Desulfovibrio sp. JC010]|uniref:radical SAM/SPASM family putative metalloenzyme maturase n=1 Tax=Desulfovibrio sp. JC010 TaxID=2593641 RepID=UPI0013D027B2|nr:radical SAM/SPASM family putative metalloenzyme maturase [Desulfovibrio sp. JC010]NDV27841.1 radical SAM/SPASM family putative metalloenzyme maturase [Desulfovibrio sp. JC010]
MLKQTTGGPLEKFPAAFREYPARLQVEVTTRCNMNCSMCVKYAPESDIPETDISLEDFKKLGPALEHCEKLVLNGIGEPLLHPGLAAMAAFARERMPKHGSIGFQTNGLLFTEARARELVEAGVDTFCISVDSVDSSVSGGELHGQSSTERLAHTFALLKQAAEHSGSQIKLGAEFVLMADTYKQLPDVIRWAAGQGAEFVLCSHVLAYHESMQEQSLFNPNTPAATELFDKWNDIARDQGQDLQNYFSFVWNPGRSMKREKLFDLIREMRADAELRGIWINLRNLADWDQRRRTDEYQQLLDIYAYSEELAAELGVDLRLPPLMAENELSCSFVEEGAAFITSNGDVSPCQFLWHSCTCYLDGSEKLLRQKKFGNIKGVEISEIWDSVPYKVFRSDVLEYEYPYCSNCPMAPCDDIIGRSTEFECDCLGVEVPCGHCPWAMGGLQCLM